MSKSIPATSKPLTAAMAMALSAPWHTLLLTIFFITGGVGLVYEVAWVRLLTTLFGASSPAIATVLTAFMVGLTLGSLAFGRWIDRRGNALLTYALLEIGIALAAFLLPWAVTVTTGVYTLFYRTLETQPLLLTALRFSHAFLLLLAPTFLMGGTLPVLLTFFTQKARTAGSQVALLYALNTLGAAVGCVVTGFVLIEALGVRGATWRAATVQLLAALLILGMRRRIEYAPSSTDPRQALTEPLPSPQATNRALPKTGIDASRISVLSPTLLALATIGYSGFAALALETLWSRLLAFFLGNTIYSFTVVLTTVLTGIALGSLLVKRWLPSIGDPLRLLGLLQWVIGLSAIVLLPVQWQLNTVRSGVAALIGEMGWWQLTFGRFVVALVALLLPTLAMGAALPCAVQVGAYSGGGRGRLIGNVYAVNAGLGALGALVAGFGLVHLLGVQRSILLLGCTSMAVGGLLVALRASSWRRRLVEAAFFVAVALVLLLLIRVNRPLITIAGLAQGFAPPYRLVDYREGSDATVAVVEDALGVRELNINGISTAFTSSWDLRIHKLLALLPLLLHSQPERVLIVGYGMGVTARSALHYPTVTQVDVAEIAPEVFAMSERFAAVNRGVRSDPRFRLILNDGKNHLLATAQRYDMISTNAIHPGVAAGNSALYTVDFYQAARDHLTTHGVLCQWLPIHQLSTDDVRTLVRSFQIVFPHTSLWFTSDFALLIGTQEPLHLDLDQLAVRLADPAVAQDLAELDDLAIRHVTDLVGYFLMDEKAVARYVGNAALHTDDHPIIEFSAPRAAYLSAATNLANLQLLYDYSNPSAAPLQTTEQSLRTAVAQRWAANREVLLGQIESYRGAAAAANQHYQQVLAVDPANVDARYLAKQQAVRAGIAAYDQGDWAGAQAAFQQAIALAPTFAEAWYRLALVAEQTQDEQALTYWEQALALQPTNARWHVELAGSYRRRGLAEAALTHLQQAVAADPAYGEAYVFLAMLYRELGQTAQAEQALDTALRLERQLGE